MNTFITETIFFPFALACLLATAITPLTIILMKRLRVYDDPSSHKHPAILHRIPIPRGGSIPLFFGVWGTALFFLTPFTQELLTIFIASLAALIIGVLDDKLDISPYLRFFVNLVTAGIVVASGITIPFITNPLGGVFQFDTISLSLSVFNTDIILRFSDLLALVWIVWVMNMLNWSKGVDGQMPGIVAISAIVIGLLSMRFSSLDANSLLATKLSFIIAGSAIGFLFFNFYPAKIFPGYGATSIYLLLAVVSILSTAKLSTAFLVMGIPMIDGAFTIIRRIISGKSPFWHDKKHLHHLLLKLGFGQRRIAILYWILSALLGGIALALSSAGKLVAILMLIVLVGGGILFLHITLRKKE